MKYKIVDIKSKVLAMIAEHNSETGISSALLARRLQVGPGVIETAIRELRQAGHLIVRNERGYFIAETRAQYTRWRKEYLLVEMLDSVQVLSAMQAAAQKRFGGEWIGNRHQTG